MGWYTGFEPVLPPSQGSGLAEYPNTTIRPLTTRLVLVGLVDSVSRRRACQFVNKRTVVIRNLGVWTSALARFVERI